MYTVSEMKQIRFSADALGLYAPPLFWELPESELVKICNGCGPEFFPDWARELADFIYRKYRAAIAIHDVEYEESDGTEISRCEADTNFYENCLIIWNKRFGWSRWINPVALYERKKIRLAYRALYYCGTVAWISAYHERKCKGDGND
jgi:hypothetical protein